MALLHDAFLHDDGFLLADAHLLLAIANVLDHDLGFAAAVVGGKEAVEEDLPLYNCGSSQQQASSTEVAAVPGLPKAKTAMP